MRQFPVFGWKDFYTEPYLVDRARRHRVRDRLLEGPHRAATTRPATLVRSYKADGLKRPTGITLDAFGHVIVTDRDMNRVFVWPLDAFH